MMKFVLSLILITLISVTPASAALCRNFNEQLICILTIKRSAKYYWEYRLSLSIDGVKTPTEIYNCRDKFKTTKDKRIISFEQDKLGDFICDWVNFT